MTRKNVRDLQAAPSVDPYDPDSVAVYRLYNQWGALLYVGIAADPKSRFIQHECEKDWWSTVASKSVKWYPNRALAALEETRVILNDMPAYNIAGAPACPTVSARLRPRIRPSQPRRPGYGPPSYACTPLC